VPIVDNVNKTGQPFPMQCPQDPEVEDHRLGSLNSTLKISDGDGIGFGEKLSKSHAAHLRGSREEDEQRAEDKAKMVINLIHDWLPLVDRLPAGAGTRIRNGRVEGPSALCSVNNVMTLLCTQTPVNCVALPTQNFFVSLNMTVVPFPYDCTGNFGRMGTETHI